MFFTGDEAKDRGLAGAVRADEAAAAAGEDLGGSVLKEDLTAVLAADVDELDQGFP
jgi:hypothetical protein